MSTRIIACTLICLLSSTLLSAADKPDKTAVLDAELLKAVKTLDEAFSKRDKETIRRMTDERHISIAPSYQFFSQKDQLEALPELKLTLFKASPKKIIHTTPSAAIITYEAQIEGTFEGKQLAKHVQILECWIKRKGEWLEVSYQETPIP
ncbi:nuclear transport factor 2 family protein [Gimesia chilikensis]|uniref:nuclear transport factor 2 family protein n=1 Tax=Gimesia chilikensis TaxID=2605989 RepID=UPI001659F931|nr:nuclear transport factor 2 family protein [Gimesia chilikensis]